MDRWSEIRSLQSLHTFKPHPFFCVGRPLQLTLQSQSQTAAKRLAVSTRLPIIVRIASYIHHSSPVSYIRPYWINRPEPSPFTSLASISLGCPGISSLALRDCIISLSWGTFQDVCIRQVCARRPTRYALHITIDPSGR